MTRSPIRSLVPAATVVCAVIAEGIFLPWPAWGVLKPNLTLIALFYWRLYRPDLCRIATPFAAGVAVDILTALPVGVNALSKMAVVLVVGLFSTRLRATYFILLIPFLMLLTAGEQLFQWGIMSLFQTVPVRWDLFVGKVVATGLLAPLEVAILIRIHRSWVEEKR